MNDPVEMPITEEEFHAYADGQLPEDRRAAMERHLKADPAAARQVAQWQAQNALLRQSYSAVRETAVTRRPQAASLRSAIAASIAVLAFGLGLTAGHFLFGSQAGQGASADGLARWSETNFLVYASDVRHPVEVGQAEKEHLLQWLSKRFGNAIKAPDLSPQGYELIGGRLVIYVGKPAALLMYEKPTGERLTLAIGRNPGNAETSFTIQQSGDVRTLYWIDGTVGYGVSGRIGKDELSSVSMAIYSQL